jgi:hypothetical protein
VPGQNPADAINFKIQDQFAPQVSLKKPHPEPAWESGAES